MPATKEKKWSPPKGWEGEQTSTVQGDETVDVFTGTRTWPDTSTSEVIGHTPEEFEANAKATEDLVRRSHAQKHAALMEEIEELQAQVRAKKQQAKQYDWAV